MKNKLMVLAISLVFFLGSANARASGLDVAGTTDVYAQINTLNFGVGVGGEHWFTYNLGLGGGISGGGDFVVANVRALLLLGTDFYIAKTPARPFVSAGLSTVQGPSYSRAGTSSQSSGAGPEFSGGVLWQTPWVKNLYFRPEVAVHLFKVKTTISNATFDSGYKSLDFTFAAVYRF